MLNKNSKVHLVGIGGIGMSGLAQLLAAVGCKVSGSDRDFDKPFNQKLFSQLKAQGIDIFPQDGSFVSVREVDALIYSTAIEAGNPDFEAAKNVPQLHRSVALEQAIGLYGENLIRVGVAGSSGKTSVTAYLGEALDKATGDVACLDGGMMNYFTSETYPGNFHSGQKYFVFEVDESDKSLLNYKLDYAIILNIGHDHYSIEELAEVFGKFSQNVSRGLVVSEHVKQAIAPWLPATLPVLVVADDVTQTPAAEVEFSASEYCVTTENPYAIINGKQIYLPQPNAHSALNLTFVGGMLKLLGFQWEEFADKLNNLNGVARRFDLLGATPNGVRVYDDYAHNPEKLACALKATELITKGRIFMIWQPHGYGPLGFMQEHLLSELISKLRPQDQFILMEPFYAGGSSSFSPHACDVVASWHKRNVGTTNIFSFENRAAIIEHITSQIANNDTILICGARDSTLPEFGKMIIENLC